MNKTYEILPEGQIKILEDVTTTKEKIVDISAVQKRVDEINSQIQSLQDELSEWLPLLDAVSKSKVDAVVPDSIDSIPSALETQ